ncbi:probable fatty acid-binding protein [Contarinia nasturtii]|uniref:probable fatty acid-binding protein n=1 Tax=Contarinia nasturtii TaxID=265458 RepID=UPI0012D46C69|nr:probable fatty acid-binding protein [Contarinia nasturtii]
MKFTIPLIALCVAVAAAKEIWEGKRYRYHESYNFDEYLKVLGVGDVLRRNYTQIIPYIELKKGDGNKYKLITTPPFRKAEIEFELGKEFDDETLDGRTVKSVMSLANDILLQKQGGEPSSNIVRAFGDKEMYETMFLNDVCSCYRIYKIDE